MTRTSEQISVLRTARDELRREVDNLRIELGHLTTQREEVERRIDDMRAFERDYRARLIAYHEHCLRDLRGEPNVIP